MSIEQYLQQILSARYGKDVRQAIHDSIEEGYNIAVQAQGIAETSQESAKAYAQAALASEQAAEDYKTAAEQAAQQAMSGTPEGYADLVAKVNSIYRQTATSYNVVGTSEGSALVHTIYGMSVQDGTPTPSVPVEIKSAKANFRCVGKNINSYPYFQTIPATQNGITFTVNDDGTIIANGTATADAYYTIHARGNEHNQLLLPFGRYKGSGCPNLGGSICIRYEVTRNGEGIVLGEDRGNGVVFTVDSGDDLFTDKVRTNVLIRINSGTTVTNLTIKPMITLADVEDSDYEHYEPYQHTDVTTNLTLRAIEVASTDDYNLVRDGKYYIADTIDWSEDKGYEITRRIARQVGGVVEWYGSRDNSKQININLELPIYTEYSIAKMNRFVQDSTHSFRAGTFWFSPSRTVLCVFLPTSVDITSIQSAQTWIDNNPTEIVYTLATPTTEPIISEQAQALLSLKTYDEATSISATGDIEPSLDLEYSKDRNTALALTGHNLAHKNALKLNDINTALIEMGGN